MAKSTHDQQISVQLFGLTHQEIADIIDVECYLSQLVFYLMCRKEFIQIGSDSSRMNCLFSEYRDDMHLFGNLQDGQCVRKGAGGFTAIIPSDSRSDSPI